MKEPAVKMYFIAIVLPQQLNEKIIAYKHFMQERFGCRVGLKSPAHITLIPPFWMEDEKEAQLLQDMDLLSSSIPCFHVSTNHFSAFKPRTIFIDVKANEELGRVKQITDAFFRQRPVYKAKTGSRPFHPHITIATRDLHKKSFYEAWPSFQGKKFEEEWIATGLSVLRHNQRNWDVIHTSLFANERPAKE
jgi:2'-5' RNA ligase